MTVNFFEREVRKTRERFNQSFGNRVVCNIEARYSAILSICRLGILGNKIAEGKEEESIQEFVRIRDVLNNFFNLMEKQRKGRRCDTQKDSGTVRLRRYVN